MNGPVSSRRLKPRSGFDWVETLMVIALAMLLAAICAVGVVKL